MATHTYSVKQVPLVTSGLTTTSKVLLLNQDVQDALFHYINTATMTKAAAAKSMVAREPAGIQGGRWSEASGILQST